MKITIYEPKEPEEKERELCLRLDDRGYCVNLDAVDPETGERLCLGTILSIHDDGVMLHPELTPGAGLPVDSEGRVKLL